MAMRSYLRWSWHATLQCNPLRLVAMLAQDCVNILAQDCVNTKTGRVVAVLVHCIYCMRSSP